MNLRSRVVLLGFMVAMFAGCASTNVVEETPMVSSELARPNKIWVYDFVADPAKLPADSSIGSAVSAPGAPPTAQELETGRQLGAAIAKDLVADIQAMGLPAVQATPGSTPQIGDAAIRGYLVSVENGNAARRFVIGFGSGSSELSAIVDGYAVTPQGWRKLGSGSLNSSGNKAPGMVAPAALAVATGSPVGVIVMGGIKLYGEASGRNTVEGRAKATAAAIAEQLKVRFQKRGWIS